jgi:glycosyltransferase involved in cell wall biosynthesis
VRIAFDVSPLSHPRTGIGNYLRGSLAGLVEASGGRDEIVAFAPTSARGLRAIPAALAGIPVEVRLRPFPWSHRVRMAWSRRGRPPVERFLGPVDVLHFSDWMYPPQRAGVRATTIHDLVPLHHPEWTTARTRAMHTRKYGNAAATCDTIFVNSAYTGRDVERTLGELGAPYVLTVATLEPRKNLQVLVEAHRLLGGELELAVVGAEGWGEQPLLDAPGIRRLGYVPDEELARLYRGAAVVAYPSRFEGFGIPVLEAMSRGCPVLAADATALPEVVGDAAVLLPLADARTWSAAMVDLLADPARRAELGAAGRTRALEFDWSAIAARFAGVYHRVLADL